MSCVTLRSCWCDVIVLNVHAPTQYKGDSTKHGSYEEVESVFGQFWKFQMKILLGDFNAKVGREESRWLVTEISLYNYESQIYTTFINRDNNRFLPLL
jgi:hypothetical protein